MRATQVAGGITEPDAAKFPRHGQNSHWGFPDGYLPATQERRRKTDEHHFIRYSTVYYITQLGYYEPPSHLKRNFDIRILGHLEEQIRTKMWSLHPKTTPKGGNGAFA